MIPPEEEPLKKSGESPSGPFAKVNKTRGPFLRYNAFEVIDSLYFSLFSSMHLGLFNSVLPLTIFEIGSKLAPCLRP